MAKEKSWLDHALSCGYSISEIEELHKKGLKASDFFNLTPQGDAIEDVPTDKAPPGFMLYFERFSVMEILKDTEIGRVFRALKKYECSGIVSALSRTEQMLFNQLCADIDRSKIDYLKVCIRNKKNRNRDS